MTWDMEKNLRTMCNLSLGITEKALKRGREEGRNEGRDEGRLDLLRDLVKEGRLSLSVAARKADMTEKEFQKIAML